MSRGVADVFREAGDRYVASLLTIEDRRRFLEAARVILALDGNTKRLSQERRSALLTAPIEDAGQEAVIIAALWPALARVLDDWPRTAALDPQPAEARLLMLRGLMARLIAGGLKDAQDRNTLREATLQLHELGSRANLSSRQKDGAKRHQVSPTETSEEDKARAGRLRSEAQKLRKDRPDLRSTRSRARVLNIRFGKEKWRTPGALIEYARRRRIEI